MVYRNAIVHRFNTSLLFILALFLSTQLNAQNGGALVLSTGFVECKIPVKSEMPKMSNVWSPSMGFSLGYQISPKFPLTFQFNASTGSYNGLFKVGKVNHTMEFDNGNQTIVPVEYNEKMATYDFGLKYNFLVKCRVSPFINPFLGKSVFTTHIVVETDEWVEDDCLPLYSEQVFKYSGLSYGARLGVDIAIGKKTHPYLPSLTLGVGILRSSQNFSYTNHKFLDNEPRPAHDPETTNGGHHQHNKASTNEIYHDFINVFTSDVHAHKVADIYHSKLLFVSFQIAFTYYIPLKKKEKCIAP